MCEENMELLQAIDHIVRLPNKIFDRFFGDYSLDKAVAKTVPKEPNWNHIEESLYDPNSIE